MGADLCGVGTNIVSSMGQIVFFQTGVFAF